jgi:hypothetical protein
MDFLLDMLEIWRKNNHFRFSVPAAAGRAGGKRQMRGFLCELRWRGRRRQQAHSQFRPHLVDFLTGKPKFSPIHLMTTMPPY